jgi:transcriptional regulator with XRE-family HTH domain
MPKKRKDEFAVRMGERISAALESLGLTQGDLARMLGVDVNTLGGAIRGYHRIQYEVLIRLPQVLHRSLYYFLGLPEPSGLSEDEQELLSVYRSYKTDQMRRLLREEARARLEVERQLVPNSAR